MTRSLSTALDSLEDWWQSSQAITQEPRNGLLAHSQAFSYSNRGWLSPPAPPRLHPAVLEAERGAAAVARDADGGSVLAKLRAENLALRERLRGAQAPGGAAEPNGVSKPSPPLKDPAIALTVVFEEASRRAAEPRSDYRSTQHAAELAATTAAAARTCEGTRGKQSGFGGAAARSSARGEGDGRGRQGGGAQGQDQPGCGGSAVGCDERGHRTSRRRRARRHGRQARGRAREGGTAGSAYCVG